MSERVLLPETGVVYFGDLPVIAQSIGVWRRYDEPDGTEALRAELVLGEGVMVQVDQGQEVDIAGARWRVEEITEDPVHHRGHVVVAAV